MTQITGKYREYLTAGTHVLVWVIFFFLPLATSSNPPETIGEFFMRSAPFFASAIVFYSNYWLLVPRFLFPRKRAFFALSNLLVYAVCIASMEQAKAFALSSGAITDAPGMDPEFLLRMVFSFISITGVCVAIMISSRWFKSERLQRDLQEEHLKSELLNLKNQLNPHFFFNTLNTIYGLIIQDQDKAQSAVHQLSKLMRYLLYDSNEQLVPLKKEIDFMHHYVDLMKLRSMPNMQVICDFPKMADPTVQIPPLLFISLIENGFKHGSSGDNPSLISIEMSLAENGDIHFNMRNTDFAKDDLDQSGSGIGLKNVEKRLQLLYPKRHEFHYKSENGIFESEIILKP